MSETIYEMSEAESNPDILNREKEVFEVFQSQGMPLCKKKKNKLMRMSHENFQAFQLNTKIAKFCQVRLIRCL